MLLCGRRGDCKTNAASSHLQAHALAAMRPSGLETGVHWQPLDWAHHRTSLGTLYGGTAQNSTACVVGCVVSRYYAIGNAANQETLHWGKAPTHLQRLCALPIRYVRTFCVHCDQIYPIVCCLPGCVLNAGALLACFLTQLFHRAKAQGSVVPDPRGVLLQKSAELAGRARVRCPRALPVCERGSINRPTNSNAFCALRGITKTCACPLVDCSGVAS